MANNKQLPPTPQHSTRTRRLEEPSASRATELAATTHGPYWRHNAKSHSTCAQTHCTHCPTPDLLLPLMEHRRSARLERRRQLAVAQSPARLPLRASSTFAMCVAQTQTQLSSLPFGPRLSQDRQHRPVLLSQSLQVLHPQHASITDQQPPVRQKCSRDGQQQLAGTGPGLAARYPPRRAEPGDSPEA